MVTGAISHLKYYHRKAKFNQKTCHLLTETRNTSSTTFTQCAMEATEFGEITQDKGHSLLKVIQGRRLWYQMKAHI